MNLIIGTGGHARTVISLLSEDIELKDLGLIDINSIFNPSEKILGVPILGNYKYIDSLKKRSQNNIYLAIGDNQKRKFLYEKFKEMGFNMPNLISKNAYMHPTCNIGDANIVCTFSYLGPSSQIGNNNILNTSSILEHEVILGSHSHLAPGSIMAGRVKAGDGLFLGSNATVKDAVVIGSNVTLGAGSVLLKNIDNIEPETYIGVPAKKRHIK